MKILWMVVLSLLLTGCGGDEDLRQFVTQMKSLKPTQIEALPEISKFTPMAFAPKDQRNPFVEPTPEELHPSGKVDKSCTQPTLDRKRAPLEQYSLDNLSMRGTIGSKGSLWALIATNDGQTYRVGLDYRMGLNHGQIIAITPKWIELKELISDGQGCWEPRTTKLMLVGDGNS